MAKPVIDARQALADIRSGMSDSVLMKKYSLSAKGLQSLLNKLVSEGLVDKSVFDRDRGVSANARREVAAKDVVEDLRSGVTDEELMDKYRLSARGLENLFDQLLETGLIEARELEERVDVTVLSTVDIRKEGFADMFPAAPLPAKEDHGQEIAIPEEVKGTPQVRPADRVETSSQITVNDRSSVADSLFMPIMPDAQTFLSKEDSASSVPTPKPPVDSTPSPAPAPPDAQPEAQSKEQLEATPEIGEEDESETEVKTPPAPGYPPPTREVEATIELTDLPDSESTVVDSAQVAEVDQETETASDTEQAPESAKGEEVASDAVPPVEAPPPGDTVILSNMSESSSSGEDNAEDDRPFAPLEYETTPTSAVVDAGEGSEPEKEHSEGEPSPDESEQVHLTEKTAEATDSDSTEEAEAPADETVTEPQALQDKQPPASHTEDRPEHLEKQEESSEIAPSPAAESAVALESKDDDGDTKPASEEDEPQPVKVAFTPPEKVAEEIATTEFLEVDDGDSEPSELEASDSDSVKPDQTASAPKESPGKAPESSPQPVGADASDKTIWKCPYCGYFQKTDFPECPRCGKARELPPAAMRERASEKAPAMRIVEAVSDAGPARGAAPTKIARKRTASPELQALGKELTESVQEMDSARLWLTRLSTVVAWLGAIQLIAVMTYVGVQLLKMPFSPGGLTYSKVVELVIVPALISVGIMIVVQAMANGLRVGAQLLKNVALGNQLMAKILESIDDLKK